MTRTLCFLLLLTACDSGGDADSVDAGAAQDAVGGAGDAAEADAAEADAAGPPAENVPGKYVRTLEVSGQTREFIVYVPEGAAGATPVPVVFMFHGTSGDGEKFYNISYWKEKADIEGFIAVFPSALTHCFHEDENGDGDGDDPGERKITTKWDGGIFENLPLCTAEEVAALSAAQRALVDHPVADDLGFVDAMLDHLATEQAVDVHRIYASGFSNGGQFTSRLARDRADRFAALAAAAGSLAVDPTPAARQVPFVFTVGTLDDRFTSATGLESLPLDDTLFTPEALGGLTAKYLTLLQLAATHTSEQVPAGMFTVTRHTFSTSLVGGTNTLVFAVMEGLFHQYPNGDNYPFALANPLWDFFEQHELP